MDTASDALVDALVQSAFDTTAVLQRIAAEHDLSLTQLRVLGILRDRQLRIGDLATYLGLEKSTLSGLVNRAAARGLVERRPSPQDQRVVEVTLTAAGHELGDRMYAAVSAAVVPRTRALNGAERDRLQHLLARLLRPGPGAPGQPGAGGPAQASSTGA